MSLSVSRIPLGLKIAYTLFIAVLVPVYWYYYGPTNFLYFCDIALFFTLVGIWREDALLLSMPAVGILLPQLLWCVDFAVELFGGTMTSMTAYMFDGNRSLFLRSLSLFHGWLPFLLFFLVRRVGYDRRAFSLWAPLSVVLCLVSYFLLPPAGAALSDPNIPRNVNYVFGLDDAQPQSWMNPHLYLIVWMALLTFVVYWPTHWLLSRFIPASRPIHSSNVNV